jgi:diacylglycerol kinase family enzyme
MRGRHENLAIVRVAASRWLRLTVAAPLILEADGEIRERRATRLEVEALPGALALLA